MLDLQLAVLPCSLLLCPPVVPLLPPTLNLLQVLLLLPQQFHFSQCCVSQCDVVGILFIGLEVTLIVKIVELFLTARGDT